jgi:hypothetical protein
LICPVDHRNEKTFFSSDSQANVDLVVE